ncbi:GumC family protein [Phocaeicola faecicola]|uniref:GumC family protein n=1 Tax=Phocaeicola faecicola TaxID=2739389 RepID=UPI0015E7B73A|nr:tyrosine-protein kinase [Phocaeicola faecicola]
MIENNQINTSNIEEQEENINLRTLLMKYLVYWPWFIASVIICLGVAFLYLRFQTPVYNSTAAVLIKETDPRSKAMTQANGAVAALQDIGGFSMTSNFDNEVEILKSRTLIKKVVSELGLYIQHSKDQTFGYDIPLYHNTPVKVHITPEEAEKLQGGAKLNMTYSPEGKLNLTAKYTLKGEVAETSASFDSLPAVLPTPVGVFSFTRNDSARIEKTIKLNAWIASPTVVAQNYATNLTVTPSSKTTTIAKISVKNTHKQRAVDFINRLVADYNQDANDEKNEVAEKTAEFIEERIGIINTELGAAENQLATFKQQAGLTDLSSDAQLALQESSKYEQLRVENATQIQLVEFLKAYINQEENANEVLPANVGLKDQNLSTVIEQYNAMIIERKRLLRTSSESNPTIINMNTGIEAMRRSVQTTVESVLKGLYITKADIDKQTSKFEARINKAPQQEKEFLTIARQQEIKAALYTMLLQKREENAITLASTATNGRIIEEALAATAPIAPKKMMLVLAALVIGIGLPIGLIFIRDLLKYKIENREDIQKITQAPIIGELPRCDVRTNGSIVIQENKNNMMEECFRSLRTNLLFMLEKGQQVILFSSTQPGEGKSFVAGNTAASLAFLGKKVLIMGMDIRKPGLNKVFRLSNRAVGITNYLSDPEHTNLLNTIQHSDISPNLDILPGGPVPPNPTELVAREHLDHAIEELKKHYDYIILDTAPIAMIADTAIIGRVADMCVYVCRADVTPKDGFEYINILQREKKLKKIATVINDIDMSKRKHSYGYGYGRRYGYGYGYGYETDQKNK